MGRNKIIHARIANDSVRRTTFKKRRKGLFKKVSEITTLCDIKACAVIYGPHDVEPEVWPNLPEATAMLQSFQQQPESMQCKKMMSQEIFLEEKLNKAVQQYEKLENEVRELYNRALMYEFMSGRDMDELNFQVARNVYGIAGLRQKVGYERMEAIMAAEGSSSEGVKYPPLTNEAYNLDAAIAPYIHEQMMQNQNQTVASSVGYQNQLNASNVNQQLMIQQPVNNYVENQNQMMIVPYENQNQY